MILSGIFFDEIKYPKAIRIACLFYSLIERNRKQLNFQCHFNKKKTEFGLVNVLI